MTLRRLMLRVAGGSQGGKLFLVIEVSLQDFIGRYILGYLEKKILIPMAQGRSIKIISMIKWIRTSRMSTNNSLSAGFQGLRLP